MSGSYTMREIDGYPNYKATSDGRIWSKRKKGFLIPSVVEGYHHVSLCRNGTIRNVFVHRIIASVFLPNPNNEPIINHKDENKTNNRVDNLEWCSYQYNNTYGKGHQSRIRNQINRPDCSKPVIQLTKDGKFVKEYPSAKEAGRQTGIRHIGEVCNHNGPMKSAGGYLWEWKTEVKR